MTTLFKTKHIDELKDRESRQIFYEEHIETGLPIQIRELRKKRKLTQKRLAELTGFDQSNISDWENPNYEYTPQISTLKRLADAFDVPLIVRFGSWQELLEWDDNLSPEKLAPNSFDEFVETLDKSTDNPEVGKVDKTENKNKVLTSDKFAVEPVQQETHTLFTPEYLRGVSSADISVLPFDSDYLEPLEVIRQPLQASGDNTINVGIELITTGGNTEPPLYKVAV